MMYKAYKILKRGRLQHHLCCEFVSRISCNVKFKMSTEFASKSFISRIAIQGRWYDFITYHNMYGTLIGASKVLYEGDK